MALANVSALQGDISIKHMWNDVIALHEISKVDGLQELIGDDAPPDEQGLFAIYTIRSGGNKGRKYCLQVVGMIPPLADPTSSAASMSTRVRPFA